MLMPRLFAGSRKICTLRSGPQCRDKMVVIPLVPFAAPTAVPGLGLALGFVTYTHIHKQAISILKK